MSQINNTREKLLDAAFLEVYVNGYHGASISSILKKANVPKGSLYHFFNSKKELILAVIDERIYPKMSNFFDFKRYKNEDIFEALERIFQKMTQNEPLLTYGCPLHRLLVEMAPLDREFDKVLIEKFNIFSKNFSNMLQTAINNKELKNFDTYKTARFFITSIWGEISMPPSISKKEYFLTHIKNLLQFIKQYQV